jgi:hypothetical protein
MIGKAIGIGTGIGVVFIGIFLAIWFKSGCGTKIIITEKPPQKHGDVGTQPTDCAGWKNCAERDIMITEKTHEDWLDVHATNGCKYADQSYRIGIGYSHMDIWSIRPGLLAGYNHGLKKFDYGFSGSLDFLRMWKIVGLGAGGDGYYMNVSKDWYVGIHATLAFSTGPK